MNPLAEYNIIKLNSIYPLIAILLTNKLNAACLFIKYSIYIGLGRRRGI